ncbi:MAG: hypothetical protein ACE5GW_07230, partial [Planctomycetota bacterium]
MASTRRRAPGGSHRVLEDSSMTAGPARRSPSSRDPRAMRGTGLGLSSPSRKTGHRHRAGSSRAAGRDIAAAGAL